MNKKALVLAEDLLRYIKANPDLRFWQAVCNWSGYKFIGTVQLKESALPNEMLFNNLYYKEGK